MRVKCEPKSGKSKRFFSKAGKSGHFYNTRKFIRPVKSSAPLVRYLTRKTWNAFIDRDVIAVQLFRTVSLITLLERLRGRAFNPFS